ncbi:MAG TPA: helix-turn-helix transcriptional regulator [Dissulfurispiraceae bacterium]|nr:helix-turn-helix transcriptional regulator [Dissulfurispiraceae bacterium]
MRRLKDFQKIKSEWLKDSEIRKEYESQRDEFQVASEVIRARARAKMTQAQLARRIGTKTPAISRLESPGYGKASLTTLKKIADALGYELQVKFVRRKRIHKTA